MSSIYHDGVYANLNSIYYNGAKQDFYFNGYQNNFTSEVLVNCGDVSLQGKGLVFSEPYETSVPTTEFKFSNGAFNYYTDTILDEPVYVATPYYDYRSYNFNMVTMEGIKGSYDVNALIPSAVRSSVDHFSFVNCNLTGTAFVGNGTNIANSWVNCRYIDGDPSEILAGKSIYSAYQAFLNSSISGTAVISGSGNFASAYMGTNVVDADIVYTYTGNCSNAFRGCSKLDSDVVVPLGAKFNMYRGCKSLGSKYKSEGTWNVVTQVYAPSYDTRYVDMFTDIGQSLNHVGFVFNGTMREGNFNGMMWNTEPWFVQIEGSYVSVDFNNAFKSGTVFLNSSSVSTHGSEILGASPSMTDYVTSVELASPVKVTQVLGDRYWQAMENSYTMSQSRFTPNYDQTYKYRYYSTYGGRQLTVYSTFKLS